MKVPLRTGLKLMALTMAILFLSCAVLASTFAYFFGSKTGRLISDDVTADMLAGEGTSGDGGVVGPPRRKATPEYLPSTKSTPYFLHPGPGRLP
jgi:hypothetical protein